MEIKDRIKELRKVRASELLPNPKNWRKHPVAQANALRGTLSEIGYADALIAYETPDGLMLIDGHLRAETTPDQEVPVLVTDLTEEEADKVLVTLDPLAAMATADDERLKALLETVSSENDGLGALLDTLANDEWVHLELDGSVDSVAGDEDGGGNLLSLLDVTIADPRHVVEVGDVWKLGGVHTLVCASVITGWKEWVHYLDNESVWFCPHPSPMVPLANEAHRTAMLLVQPDVYVAGHILDRYVDVNGESSVRKVLS